MIIHIANIDATKRRRILLYRVSIIRLRKSVLFHLFKKKNLYYYNNVVHWKHCLFISIVNFLFVNQQTNILTFLILSRVLQKKTLKSVQTFLSHIFRFHGVAKYCETFYSYYLHWQKSISDVTWVNMAARNLKIEYSNAVLIKLPCCLQYECVSKALNKPTRLNLDRSVSFRLRQGVL